MFRQVLVVAMVTFFSYAQAQGQNGSDKALSFERQYSEVLDAFFDSARETSETAIILRVWGGLSPEYEIVLDPEIAPMSLTVLTASKPIWGNAYSLAKPRLSADESIAAARKIGVSKRDLPVAEEQLRELWRRALAVDPSVSEHGPFRDSKGREVLILDAPYFEIIMHAGRTRAHVTDTSGSDIVSGNPMLLHWALDMERAAANEGKISH